MLIGRWTCFTFSTNASVVGGSASFFAAHGADNSDFHYPDLLSDV